jgi:hypothetical protein
MAYDGQRHPIDATYLDVQTARAAAALPAAGAFDATPLELACNEFSHVTFYITYTRGAVGGAMEYYIESSPYSADIAGVEDWFRTSILAAGAVVINADTVSNIQRESYDYGATAAAAENFVYGPLELQGTVQRIRIVCAESGVVLTPGTAHIVAVFA